MQTPGYLLFNTRPTPELPTPGFAACWPYGSQDWGESGLAPRHRLMVSRLWAPESNLRVQRVPCLGFTGSICRCLSSAGLLSLGLTRSEPDLLEYKIHPSEPRSPIASLPSQAMSPSTSPTVAAPSGLESHAGLIYLLLLIAVVVVVVIVVVTHLLSRRRRRHQKHDNENPLPTPTHSDGLTQTVPPPVTPKFDDGTVAQGPEVLIHGDPSQGA